MRAIIAISFVSLVLLMSSREAVTVVDFLYNQGSIAEAYCVNKAKPELQCNGKCHLRKAISKQVQPDEQQQPNSSDDKKSNPNIYIIEDLKNLDPWILPKIKKKTIMSARPIYARDHLKDIFHPPRLY